MKTKYYRSEVSDALEVLHLKLWDGSVFDYSLSGNNGTATGASYADRGYAFDGSGQYITLNTAFNYTSEPFSIFMWGIRAADAQEYIFWTGNFNSNGYFFEVRSNGTLRFYTNKAGVSVASLSTAVVPVDTWTHIGMTRNATSVKLYLDGVDVTTTSGSHTDPDAGVTNAVVGAGSGGSLDWTGRLSDVRVYTEARTAAQIKDLYEQTRWRYNV